eukprot:1157664-Pelagomonas_calceolata.AAC.5
MVDAPLLGDPHLGCGRGLNLDKKLTLRNTLGRARDTTVLASWLQENDRHLWLEDHGMDVYGVYKAGHPRANKQTPCERAAAGAAEHQWTAGAAARATAGAAEHQWTAAARTFQQQLDAIQQKYERVA